MIYLIFNSQTRITKEGGVHTSGKVQIVESKNGKAQQLATTQVDESQGKPGLLLQQAARSKRAAREQFEDPQSHDRVCQNSRVIVLKK